MADIGTARLAGRVREASPLFLNGPSGCFAADGSLLPVGDAHATMAAAAGSSYCDLSSHGLVVLLTWLRATDAEAGIIVNTSALAVEFAFKDVIHQIGPYGVLSV